MCNGIFLLLAPLLLWSPFSRLPKTPYRVSVVIALMVQSNNKLPQWVASSFTIITSLHYINGGILRCLVTIFNNSCMIWVILHIQHQEGHSLPTQSPTLKKTLTCVMLMYPKIAHLVWQTLLKSVCLQLKLHQRFEACALETRTAKLKSMNTFVASVA